MSLKKHDPHQTEKPNISSYYRLGLVLLAQGSNHHCLNPNSAIDNCGIDLRLVINGLQKPLKRFVHRD